MNEETLKYNELLCKYQQRLIETLTIPKIYLSKDWVLENVLNIVDTTGSLNNEVKPIEIPKKITLLNKKK